MRKILYILFFAIFVSGVMTVIMLYTRIWRSNIELPSGESVLVYIPTGSGFQDVYGRLKGMAILRDTASFHWVAVRKNYPRHVQPGRYRIRPGMSNDRLVGMLRAGEQEPVELVFHNIRSPEMLAGVVSGQIEADSVSILSLFTDSALLAANHLTRETVIGIFIPNTYEMYWNTTAQQFFDRMLREYRKFWTDRRTSQSFRDLQRFALYGGGSRYADHNSS